MKWVAYRETRSGENVDAAQYQGIGGTIEVDGARIYVDDGDWIVRYRDRENAGRVRSGGVYITAFADASFVARFALRVL